VKISAKYDFDWAADEDFYEIFEVATGKVVDAAFSVVEAEDKIERLEAEDE
jgi:hypothetical protein